MECGEWIIDCLPHLKHRGQRPEQRVEVFALALLHTLAQPILLRLAEPAAEQVHAKNAKCGWQRVGSNLVIGPVSREEATILVAWDAECFWEIVFGPKEFVPFLLVSLVFWDGKGTRVEQPL